MSSSVFPRGSSLLFLPAAALAASCALMLGAATRADAASCGDDVDGKRVPCACGDEVVSDTVLWATDPVVSEPCSGDGLVVLAPIHAEGITLNLGGQSIVGNGSGAGILVARGGRLGATIVGGDADDTRAEIVNFQNGISAHGRNLLREVSAIDIRANRLDGLKIRTSGVRIEDVVSEANGREGVAVSGHGNAVSGVVATRNNGDGIQVRGSGATIDADTSGNRRNGTVLGGRGHRVEAVRSADNGGAGVVATGAGHDVTGLQTSGNGGGDVTGRPGATK